MIVVVSHCHGTLVELLKLIEKCLSVIGIEIVVSEQPFKYVLSHGAGVVAEQNGLPPCTGDNR